MLLALVGQFLKHLGQSLEIHGVLTAIPSQGVFPELQGSQALAARHKFNLDDVKLIPL